VFVLNKFVVAGVGALFLESDTENDEMINHNGQPNHINNYRFVLGLYIKHSERKTPK
jgi:hypothetical protein